MRRVLREGACGDMRDPRKREERGEGGGRLAVVQVHRDERAEDLVNEQASGFLVFLPRVNTDRGSDRLGRNSPQVRVFLARRLRGRAHAWNT